METETGDNGEREREKKKERETLSNCRIHSCATLPIHV
jgi:hypothetical protein